MTRQGGSLASRLSNLPIGRKLQGIVMLTTVVALVLTGVVFAVYEYYSFRQKLVGQVSALARVIGNDSGPSLLFGDPDAARASLATLGSVPQIDGGQLLTADGTVFAVYRRAGVERELRCRPSGSAGRRFVDGELELWTPIAFEGETLGTICLFAPLSDTAAQLWRYAGLMSMVLSAILLLALALSAVLQKLISKPILELVDATQSVTATQDYSVRVRPRSDDEIGRLAKAFNEMLIKAQEHKRELIAARAKAERAAAAESEFLAHMSHELRTPMNAVIGVTSLMLETELDAQQRRYMELLNASGDNLLTMINDVLDFSKIEAGHMELETRPFDVRSCVREALDLVAATATAKGLTMRARIADDVPERIIGDVVRVRQILVNLLSNAVKFTDRGEVRVTATSRPLSDGRFELELAVRDTGIGIPAERIEHIFRAFKQGDSSMSRQFGGTGLGLSICKRLAGMMGGSLGVESEVGRGSVFRLRLLVRDAPASPSAKPAGAGRRRSARGSSP